MEFSRQEYWRGLPFPSPGNLPDLGVKSGSPALQVDYLPSKPPKKKKKKEVAQLCPTLCDPTDCSLPGSSIHGIFQARVLEWVAVSFSRESSQSRDLTQVSCIAGRRFMGLSHQGSPKSRKTTWWIYILKSPFRAKKVLLIYSSVIN